jgi:hypothetical protein
MRYLIVIAFTLCLSSFSLSQNRLWVSSAVRTNVFTDNLRIQGALQGRFYDNGRYDKIFPELSVRYEIAKWLEPSVDYRLIFNQSRTSYERSTGHRLNLNLNTGIDYDRFDFQLRVRYQYSFARFSGNSGYDPDFDNAVRIKPKIKYNIKGSKIDPLIESEWFYNTNYGEFGKQFVKYRFAVGVDINLPKKHELTIKYRYDYEFNVPNPWRSHVLSIGHTYEYERDNYKIEGL